MAATQVMKISDFADVIPGATNTIFEKEAIAGAKAAKLLTGNGVTAEGTVDISSLSSVWIKPGKNVSRFIVKAGDVVLLARGSGVRAGLVTAEIAQEPILASANFLIIRPRSPVEMSGAALSAYLNTKPGKRALENMSKGSVIQSIPSASLRDMEIPVPSQEAQNMIEAISKASQEALLATLALAEQQQQAAQAKILRLMHA